MLAPWGSPGGRAGRGGMWVPHTPGWRGGGEREAGGMLRVPPPDGVWGASAVPLPAEPPHGARPDTRGRCDGRRGETAAEQTIKGAGSAALRSAAFVPPPARRRRPRPRPRARSPVPRRRPHAPAPAAEPPPSPASCPNRRWQRRTAASGPGPGPRLARNERNRRPRPASWVRQRRGGGSARRRRGRVGAAGGGCRGAGGCAGGAGGPVPAARCGCRRDSAGMRLPGEGGSGCPSPRCGAGGAQRTP